jgi:hypothetical protein
VAVHQHRKRAAGSEPSTTAAYGCRVVDGRNQVARAGSRMFVGCGDGSRLVTERALPTVVSLLWDCQIGLTTEISRGGGATGILVRSVRCRRCRGRRNARVVAGERWLSRGWRARAGVGRRCAHDAARGPSNACACACPRRSGRRRRHRARARRRADGCRRRGKVFIAFWCALFECWVR